MKGGMIEPWQRLKGLDLKGLLYLISIRYIRWIKPPGPHTASFGRGKEDTNLQKEHPGLLTRPIEAIE